MLQLEGIPVSPGIAVGEVMVMDEEGFRIPLGCVAHDAVENELARLDAALESVAVEIEDHRSRVERKMGVHYAAIFDAHLQILRDEKLGGEMRTLIRERQHSAEYAASTVLRQYADVFRSLNNTMAERASDLFDIESRLLRTLSGKPRQLWRDLVSPVIVLASTLTPSETAALDTKFVRAFVTETGGPGSHTAIVAQGLEIPAVVGTGRFLRDVSGGDMAIVDGDRGRVILRPDRETIDKYTRKVERQQVRAIELAELRDLPAVTLDNVRIDLAANIEFPDEVDSCHQRGADGVGLYRTEFLYLGRDDEPAEEDHFRAYARVARSMGDRPVVIRTLDLGADKVEVGSVGREEKNPFLGLRSIRLSLRDVPRFRTQLRAILRASALGNVQVMFPLISTVAELRKARMLLADVMEDLDEEGIDFDRELKVGIMVEVPSAVLMLDELLEHADFISIGTNDLVQYTLAVDRSNNEVAPLYNSADPAVLRLIRLSLDAASRWHIDASLCGQMSANPIYTMLLLGLGLRKLSVAPSAIPEVKRAIRSLTIPRCQEVAQYLLSQENARDIRNYLKQELRKTLRQPVAV